MVGNGRSRVEIGAWVAGGLGWELRRNHGLTDCATKDYFYETAF